MTFVSNFFEVVASLIISITAANDDVDDDDDGDDYDDENNGNSGSDSATVAHYRRG